MVEFFNMGGYAGFIWPSWAIALGVLGVLVMQSLKSMRSNERLLADMEVKSPRRRRRAAHKDEKGEE
ncbi:MAG: heme exporter protein CcmD [Rhodospirillaceae bacterium]|nr:heme exporter protein CcmD [Rhodospirillaceae bacterium]